MKLIERLKKDKETLNNIKDNKSKWIFIWDYYKLPIFIIALLFVVIVYSLFNLLMRKPVLMYTVLVNSDSQIVEVDESVFIRELEKAGINVDNKIVDINDYLTLGMDQNESEDAETLQVLNALFYISDLDVFVGFKDDFEKFVIGNAYLNLGNFIDQDLLNKKKNDLYKYVDENGNEIIGGIVLHSDSPLHKANYYHGDVVIGIANNAVNLDNAIAFVKQLLID